MWLYDNNHKKTEFLAHYKDRNIVSVLSTGDKTLNFKYPMSLAQNLKEESYIRTKTDEYVIKQTKTNNEYLEVTATLNVEELEGKSFESFSSNTKTIKDCLTTMFTGTGWSVGYCDVTKKRTIVGTYKNAWTLLQECINTYSCEIEIDTINKIINIYSQRGSDKGVFMIDGVNIKALNIQGSSYDFYTRLIPIGKDGLNISSINNGKKYIENYSYSSKVKTTYWKDERYTDVNHLYEDAVIKLGEISQPVESYEVNLYDLAKMNPKYKAYEFDLGDIVILKSKAKNVKLKNRIVKYTDYPENPQNNKVEVSTTKITLEQIQKKYNDTVDTVGNTINADGTISNTTGLDVKDGSVTYNKLNDYLRDKIDSLSNFDGSNLKDNTISEEKLDEELKDKINYSILKNRKMLLIGDDFIAGGNLESAKTWGNLIATKNDMTLYDKSTNGSSITYFEDEEIESISETIESIISDIDYVDYIVFCAGHIDSYNSLDIGLNTDISNITLKGALNMIFTAIIEKYPTANILVLSPFNRTNNEENYVNAIKEIAGIYCIPFFDNYHDLGISMNNESQKEIYESEDSLFLNAVGHTKISLKYENLLKNL